MKDFAKYCEKDRRGPKYTPTSEHNKPFTLNNKKCDHVYGVIDDEKDGCGFIHDDTNMDAIMFFTMFAHCPKCGDALEEPKDGCMGTMFGVDGYDRETE